MPIINRVADLSDEIAARRRDIHAHPELGYEEKRTSGIVAEKLKAFGCDEVVTGIAKTGVVGVIRGKSNASGKVIGMRADMDCLPDSLRGRSYYHPTQEGREKQLAQRMEEIRKIRSAKRGV